jgi:hypothetical protein
MLTCGRYWKTLAAVAAVVACTAGRVWAAEEGSFEYWAHADFRVPINEQWCLTFEERLTFGEDARRLTGQQPVATVTYSGLADWLAVGVGFRHVFKRDGDEWRTERRPEFNVTARGELFTLDVIDRSRLEYRDREDQENVWRYRNKVTIVPPVTFTAWKIQPYAADEIFVNFDEQDFNEQRLYGGFLIPLHKQVRLELYYFWRLTEQDDNSWHDTNVLGSFLHIQF